MENSDYEGFPCASANLDNNQVKAEKMENSDEENEDFSCVFNRALADLKNDEVKVESLAGSPPISIRSLSSSDSVFMAPNPSVSGDEESVTFGQPRSPPSDLESDVWSSVFQDDPEVASSDFSDRDDDTELSTDMELDADFSGPKYKLEVVTGVPSIDVHQLATGFLPDHTQIHRLQSLTMARGPRAFLQFACRSMPRNRKLELLEKLILKIKRDM